MLNWLLLFIIQMELSLEPWKAPREKRFVFGQIVLAENKDLTNIEAAPPGLLPRAAEADRGEGDIGHIGHLHIGLG